MVWNMDFICPFSWEEESQRTFILFREVETTNQVKIVMYCFMNIQNSDNLIIIVYSDIFRNHNDNGNDSNTDNKQIIIITI